MSDIKNDIQRKAIDYIASYLNELFYKVDDEKLKLNIKSCYSLISRCDVSMDLNDGYKDELYERLEQIKIMFHDDGYVINNDGIISFGMGYSVVTKYDFSELMFNVKKILCEYNRYLVDSGDIYTYNFYNSRNI